MYYLVLKGKSALLSIYDNEEEYSLEMKQSPEAKSKEFNSLKELFDFLPNILPKDKKMVEVKEPNIKHDGKTVIAYVDGSFKDGTPSYGTVLLNTKEEKIGEFYGFSSVDPSMRNVSGEITAAIKAVGEALKLKYEKIILHYDYKGIECWATGEWKANKPGTQKYKELMVKAQDQIKIEFVKVKGHSGNKWNDYADSLAAKAYK